MKLRILFSKQVSKKFIIKIILRVLFSLIERTLSQIKGTLRFFCKKKLLFYLKNFKIKK
jgi:hypothetical protein